MIHLLPHSDSRPRRGHRGLQLEEAPSLQPHGVPCPLPDVHGGREAGRPVVFLFHLASSFEEPCLLHAFVLGSSGHRRGGWKQTQEQMETSSAGHCGRLGGVGKKPFKVRIRRALSSASEPNPLGRPSFGSLKLDVQRRQGSD